MERKNFIFILYLIQTLRCLIGPLLIVIGYPLSAKVRERLNFEAKNFLKEADPKRSNAYMAFEVSSEGEFEQVRPVIDYLLKKGLIVEVIYASESLEAKMIALTEKEAGFRSLRLPVLSFSAFSNSFTLSQNIRSFLTAPRLVLCRYDFYPELLLYGLRKGVQFSLVSATLKNKEDPSWFLRQVYKGFDSIVCTSHKDEGLMRDLSSKEARLATYEFRVLQIMERIKNKDQRLLRIKEILEWICEAPRDSRIIFGSVWENETEVFSHPDFCQRIKDDQLRVVLLPHQYDPGIQASIKTVKTYLYNDGDDFDSLYKELKENPGVLVLNVHGILCELYSHFGHSFVGGGHGRSVHSVLEPFFSGCHIYCGPKIHRSTEIDFVKAEDLEGLSIIQELEGFYRAYLQVPKIDKTEARHKLGMALYSDFERIVNLLLETKI
ncbi:MAG: 3-deoxy-D-manno-octulosonic-acid transferase [Bacteriovoracaceae bacterium]|jgi:3-deoxy-D-manno-octulosonic-acid transferase